MLSMVTLRYHQLVYLFSNANKKTLSQLGLSIFDLDASLAAIRPKIN